MTRPQREPVTIIDTIPPTGDEVDDAFDRWREATSEAEVPGKITAWQIPMDAQGVPQPSAKNQIRLGAFPVDAYNFDDLCSLLIRDYMPPEKVLCVRLLGTKAGSSGLQFNRVVTLRAPNTPPPAPSADGAAPESTAALMKAIQENNAQLMAQFRSMLPAASERPDATAEMQRMLAFARMMNEPTTELMKLLLPALAGRPAAPATASGDTLAQLSGMVDLVDKLRGGGGDDDGGGGGSDLVQAIRAVIPIAKPALEAIPAILAARPSPPPQRTLPRPAPPVGVRPQPPGAVPTRPPGVMPPGAAPTVLQPPPAAAPSAAALTDIPTGDQQMMLQQLKGIIDTLVAMAAQGSDPTGAADVAFEQEIMELSDEDYDKTYKLLTGPNFITMAAVLNPGVTANAEWFKQFAVRVVERYDAEEKAFREAPTAG